MRTIMIELRQWQADPERKFIRGFVEQSEDELYSRGDELSASYEIREENVNTVYFISNTRLYRCPVGEEVKDDGTANSNGP